MSGYDLATAVGRHLYALELHRRALAQWDLVYKPWRYFEWRRERRAIKAGVRELRKAVQQADFDAASGRWAVAQRAVDTDWPDAS